MKGFKDLLLSYDERWPHKNELVKDNMALAGFEYTGVVKHTQQSSFINNNNNNNNNNNKNISNNQKCKIIFIIYFTNRGR